MHRLRFDLQQLKTDPRSLFVPPTEHCERILRKGRDSRTKQEVEYLKAFLLQFLPFQSLSDEGIENAVKDMKYERYRTGISGTYNCVLVCTWALPCVDVRSM